MGAHTHELQSGVCACPIAFGIANEPTRAKKNKRSRVVLIACGWLLPESDRMGTMKSA